MSDDTTSELDALRGEIQELRTELEEVRFHQEVPEEVEILPSDDFEDHADRLEQEPKTLHEGRGIVVTPRFNGGYDLDLLGGEVVDGDPGAGGGNGLPGIEGLNGVTWYPYRKPYDIYEVTQTTFKIRESQDAGAIWSAAFTYAGVSDTSSSCKFDAGGPNDIGSWAGDGWVYIKFVTNDAGDTATLEMEEDSNLPADFDTGTDAAASATYYWRLWRIRFNGTIMVGVWDWRDIPHIPRMGN
ncbi:MAG: hypothetical protein GY851_00390 [bacterium]|nr:hypothetical protein [bacterium]